MLLLAVATTVDPAQIGPVAYILSRRSPMRGLAAYVIGALGVSLIAGSLIVFAFGLTDVGKGSSVPPGVEIAAGALALVVAALAASGLAGRLRDRVRSRHAGDRPADEHAPAGDRGNGLADLPGFEKLPRRLKSLLRSESPWLAWLYGVAYGLPGAYYLAAIAAGLRAGGGTAERVAALLLFIVVAFAVAEIPLVSFAVAPEQTRACLDRLNAWASAHRRLVVTALASIVGVYLLVAGISRL